MSERSINDVIAERVRSARRRADLSQQQLADMTGGVLSGSAVGYIEREPINGRPRRAVSVEDLFALAAALKVHPIALTGADVECSCDHAGRDLVAALLALGWTDPRGNGVSQPGIRKAPGVLRAAQRRVGAAR